MFKFQEGENVLIIATEEQLGSIGANPRLSGKIGKIVCISVSSKITVNVKDDAYIYWYLPEYLVPVKVYNSKLYKVLK